MGGCLVLSCSRFQPMPLTFDSLTSNVEFVIVQDDFVEGLVQLSQDGVTRVVSLFLACVMMACKLLDDNNEYVTRNCDK